MLDLYLPIIVVIGIAFAFAIGSVVMSKLVGVKRYSELKMSPYECGVPPIGNANERFSVKFYAIMFKQLGWYGAIAMGIFIFVLVIGFIYDWKKGALEWE